MQEYIKLGALVGQVFTVNKVGGYQFKMWNPQTNKMDVSDTPQKGFQKKYRVETDKGILELSQSQLSQLLEQVVKEGVADVNGRSYEVKSNGKTGVDIRYFLNVVTSQPKPESMQDPAVKAKLEAQRPPVDSYEGLSDDPIDLSDVPF